MGDEKTTESEIDPDQWFRELAKGAWAWTYPAESVAVGRSLVRKGRFQVSVSGVTESGSIARLQSVVGLGAKGNQFVLETELVSERDGSLAIRGACSCGVQQCGHEAALLLHLAQGDVRAECAKAAKKHISPAPSGVVQTPTAPDGEGAMGEELQGWVDSLFDFGSGGGADNADSEAENEPIRKNRRLLFVLESEARGSSLRLRAVNASTVGDGFSRTNWSNCDLDIFRDCEALPAYATARDADLLREAISLAGGGDDLKIGSGSWLDLLSRIASSTGRLFLNISTEHHLELVSLARAGSRVGQLLWLPGTQRGDLRPALATEPPVCHSGGGIGAGDPPLYVDAQTGEFGQIDVEFPASTVRRWVGGPEVSRDVARTLGAALRKAGKARGKGSDQVGIPLPESVDIDEVDGPPDGFTLRLTIRDAAGPSAGRWSGLRLRSLRTAELFASYGGTEVACEIDDDWVWDELDGKDTEPEMRRAADQSGSGNDGLTPVDVRLPSGQMRRYLRNGPAEREAVRRLHRTLLGPIAGTFRKAEIARDSRSLFVMPEQVIASFDQALPGRSKKALTPSVKRLPKDPAILAAWGVFIADYVPDLQADGWSVEIPDGFGTRFVTPSEDQWFTDLGNSVGDDSDWFELRFGVSIDGLEIDLLEVLLQAIELGRIAPDGSFDTRDGALLVLPMPSGSDDADAASAGYLRLPITTLARPLKYLHELLGDRPLGSDGRLRVHRIRAAQIASMDSTQTSLRQTDAVLTELAAALADSGQPEPVDPPDGFRAVLRDYQREGVGWLSFMRRHRLGCILADDMGLGKTVQLLAHIAKEKAAGNIAGPVLVVAPTSVVPNWRREAQRFDPSLQILILQGADRAGRFNAISSCDLVLTSYALLHRDAEKLAQYRFEAVALDEAQHIKNPRSKVAAAARDLNAPHRICLTGTPLENHLGEVWSLFHFLMPGFLGDEPLFRKVFRNPIEKRADQERQQALAARIGPLVIRRTKEQVATELPPKTEIVQTMELHDEQKEIYETVRATMDRRVREAVAEKGLAASSIIVLDALLKLRQICCDPRLLKLDLARQAETSAKLERLMEILPVMVDEGRKVLLFSQFTSMLALIEAELKSSGIGFAKLTGSTRDREAEIAMFQDGHVPVFLISLKAGGTGLNLTAADTVIHYDPWWNPAAENQATDRAHRIGQDKPVFVHRLICAGSIEERIQEMQQRKADLAEGILTGQATRVSFTETDLEMLLSPLS